MTKHGEEMNEQPNTSETAGHGIFNLESICGPCKKKG